MNNKTLTAPSANKLNTNPHTASSDPAEADILSICFSPAAKLLSAHWLKPMNSGEYRQSVRMIARSIALLRAEFILIDASALSTITAEDQIWTANFLRDVLSKLSIKKSARVLSTSSLQHEGLQKVENLTGGIPYETKVFQDPAKAKIWLLEGQAAKLTDEGRVNIGLNYNVKLLHREVLNKIAQASGARETPAPAAPATQPEHFILRTDFVSISLSKEENLLSIRWKRPPESRQYRFGMLKAERALREHKLERLLLNNQRLGVLTLEDQGWLVTTSIKLLPRTSLKLLAVVTSPDAMQQMTSEAIGSRLKAAQLPYETRYFLSEEEALEWLMFSEDQS
jgi:hypothetical protein